MCDLRGGLRGCWWLAGWAALGFCSGLLLGLMLARMT